MITFDKINVPQFAMILIGAIISQVGLVVGALMRYTEFKNTK